MNSEQLDYSKVTDYLFIGVTPKSKDYDLLQKLGIKLVINMRAERYSLPTKTKKSINTIWVPSFDSKLTPISLKGTYKAAIKANSVIKDGGKIYIYCRSGKHRSVAMAAALLISQGYSTDSAIELIKNNRLVADPEASHIRKFITKFELFWSTQNS